MRKSLISALALGAALAVSTLTAAQDAPKPAHPGWENAGMREHMRDRMAAHLKAFHDALNIRPDQEAAFAVAVAAVHPDRDGRQGEHDGMGDDHDKMAGDHAAMAAMTTPERLDMIAHKMDEHMARMREHLQRMTSAVKALYAVLSPDQRHTFDALTLMMGHHGGGMGGMGGMGHEHEMGGMGPMGGDHPE